MKLVQLFGWTWDYAYALALERPVEVSVIFSVMEGMQKAAKETTKTK